MNESNALNKSFDQVNLKGILNGGAPPKFVPDSPTMTSLPLDNNFNRHQKIVTDRAERTKSRMMKLNQYLDS